MTYDPLTASGVNAGLNPVQTAAPGETITTWWYAGHSQTPASGERVYTPVEFGAANLLPADPLFQHPKGLFGALVIEPAGASWVEDANTRLQATVIPAEGESFREGVLLVQDDLELYFKDAAGDYQAVNVANVANFSGQVGAINYGFESPLFRISPPFPITLIADDASASSSATSSGTTRPSPPDTTVPPKYGSLVPSDFVDQTCWLADAQFGRDPATTVLTAHAGTPYRIRLLHPTGNFTPQTFVLHGHGWQEEPYVPLAEGENSGGYSGPGLVPQTIGANPFSQWLGSQGGVGSAAHFDVVLAPVGDGTGGVLPNGAGGTRAVPGDYLYRSWQANGFMGGLWGIFRVGPKVPAGTPSDVVAVLSAVSDGEQTTVVGRNSSILGSRPGEPRFAHSVTLHAGEAVEGGCTGEVIATLELDRSPTGPSIGWRWSGTLAGGTRLRAGETVRFQLELADTTAGAALRGARPAAWMSRLRRDDSRECAERVAGWLAGDLFSRAEVDLNTYRLVTLDRGGTLSVVDPLFGFGGSRLLALVELAAPGDDWALLDQHRRLFVSQPGAGRVAVVDTDTWKLERQLEIAPGVGRLAATPDGTRVWAADPAGLSAIDAASAEVVARLPLDGEVDELVLDDTGRFAFATLRATGELAIIATRGPRLVARIPTGERPVALAWSGRGQAVWVAHAGGAVAAIEIDARGTPRVRHRLELEPGLAALRFAPDGRLAFALAPENDRLDVIDAARGRRVQTATMDDGPDQLAFSEHLAYVRQRDSDTVLMVPLETSGREGEPIQAADFPAGKHAFGRDAEGRALAPIRAGAFDRVPAGDAVVVANPGDEAIYYYTEGMAAPMGHFRNPGRQPLAVKVIDRSLGETRPGVYQTTAPIHEPGRYQVAVFLDTPRLVHCFEVEVEPGEIADADRMLVVRLAEPQVRRRTATAVEIVLEAIDRRGEPVAGLVDLGLLALRPAGGWHHRGAARELSAGRYAVTLELPASGDVLVYAEAPSQGLQAQGQALLHLRRGRGAEG